jgi:hypothetical protein
MLTVDLYMNSPSRILSKHKTAADSRIVYGYEYQDQRPIMFELRNGSALTYDIISLDAE